MAAMPGGCVHTSSGVRPLTAAATSSRAMMNAWAAGWSAAGMPGTRPRSQGSGCVIIEHRRYDEFSGALWDGGGLAADVRARQRDEDFRPDQPSIVALHPLRRKAAGDHGGTGGRVEMSFPRAG